MGGYFGGMQVTWLAVGVCCGQSTGGAGVMSGGCGVEGEAVTPDQGGVNGDTYRYMDCYGLKALLQVKGTVTS